MSYLVNVFVFQQKESMPTIICTQKMESSTLEVQIVKIVMDNYRIFFNTLVGFMLTVVFI